MKHERYARTEKLAKRMMHDVYHPFTACIWLDESGEIIDLYLFDTLYCRPGFSSSRRACECILISNHFDGDMRPFEEDIRNWRALGRAQPEAVCHLLIYSEYEGLCAVEETQQAGK